MIADIPAPWWTLLALPLLAGVCALGRFIGARCDLSLGSAQTLAWCTYLLALHLACLLCQGFLAGFAIATLITGAAGWVLGLRVPTRRGWHGWAPDWSAILVAALMLPLLIGSDMYDKVNAVCSTFGMANQILNGAYPPRQMSFPDMLASYHYGSSTLAAALMASTRLRVDVVFDVMTLAAALFCLSSARGALRAAGLESRWAAVALFCGGFPWFAGALAGDVVRGAVDIAATGIGNVQGRLNPAPSAYFFQAPFIIGFPVLFALLEMAAAKAVKPWQWLAAMAALAISNTAVFLAAGCAFAVAFALPELAKGRVLRAIFYPVSLAGCALAGPLVGRPEMRGAVVFSPSGPAGSVAGNLLWMIAVLGACLPCGLLGFSRLERGPLRAALWLLAAGGLLAVAGFRFEGSWDIVKFATIGHVALGFGTAVLCARCAAPASRLLALLVTAPILLFFLPSRPDWPPPYEGPLAAMIRERPAQTAEAVAWLRKHIEPGESVLLPHRDYLLSSLGGFPQPWTDWATPAFHIPAERLTRRRELLTGSLADPALRSDSNAMWAILDEAVDGDRGLLGDLNRRGAVGATHRFGQVTVCRLVRPPP